MEWESQRFPVVGLCCYIENTFCLPNRWVDLKHGGKCHAKSSVPRLAENWWLVKVKMVLAGGKKKWSLSTPYPVCFYFCLCSFFLVCRSFVLPPYLFSFLYLNLLIFPFSIFFLRWRAKWKMKAASVSSHIPSSRPPIFSCTSKSPKQVGLCVLILPLHLSTQHRAPSFQPFSVSWTLSANLFSVLTSFLCPKYVCWPVVPSIILFLYSISL